MNPLAALLMVAATDDDFSSVGWSDPSGTAHTDPITTVAADGSVTCTAPTRPNPTQRQVMDRGRGKVNQRARKTSRKRQRKARQKQRGKR